MSKPKLSDIAKRANVSTATVDRVIHGRGRPKTETLLRVRQAIEDMGYRPNLAAVQLASKNELQIGVVLPAARNPFLKNLERLALQCREDVRGLGIQMQIVRFRGEDPIAFAEAFSAFCKSLDGCIVLGPYDPAVVNAIRDGVDRGLCVATIVSDQPGSRRTFFVGPDNYSIGATAANLIAPYLWGLTDKRILVVKPALIQNDHEARYTGFCQGLGNEGITMAQIEVVNVPSDDLTALKILSTSNKINAVYFTGGEVASRMMVMDKVNIDQALVVATDLTEDTRGLLISKKLQFVVGADTNRLFSDALAGMHRMLREPLWRASDVSCPIHVYNRANIPTRISPVVDAARELDLSLLP